MPDFDVCSDTAGAMVAAALAGTAPTFYAGWGTGAGDAASSDTTLFTEMYSTANTGGTQRNRPTCTPTTTTTTFTGDSLQLDVTMTAVGTVDITNAGVFDSNGLAADMVTPPSGGNLFGKHSFATIHRTAAQTIAFTFIYDFAPRS